jgi:hypothetical protein
VEVRQVSSSHSATSLAVGGVPAQLPAGSRALTWRSTAASRSATGRNSALCTHLMATSRPRRRSMALSQETKSHERATKKRQGGA